MKRIPLTQGFFAIVDEENYKSLSKQKWCAACFVSAIDAARAYDQAALKYHGNFAVTNGV